jgi:hypothetical protein
MALKSTLEQLEEVQTAISRVLESQEYKTALGNNQKYAELEALEAREKRLLDRYERENNKSFVQGNFNHRGR